MGKLLNKITHIKKGTAVIIAVIILIALIGGVFAKYIYDTAGGNLLSAKEFYFTSNLLKEETGKYVLNSTTTEVSFTLGNNADKLRFSEVDITYNVSIECENGGEVPQIIDSNTEHKLLGGSVNKATITLKNLAKGKTYIVTATGENGYKQTLKAEFTVSDNDENVYKHLNTENDAFVLLTVWTDNVLGDLTVATDSTGLIPDNTNPILREVYNYSDGKYGAIEFADQANFDQTYSSYTYRFFVSEGSFNVDNFKVSVIKNETEYLAIKADLPK
ncbi:MAG: hypothetical protein E7539_02720 [Ruminococcaceae bacterium]|nr:hypothetical protein [Oscillospiraceae bacterium]